MLLVARKDTGFPIGDYVRKALLPMLAAVLPSGLLALLLWWALPVAWWRFLVVAAACAVTACAGVWLWGLTEGEKAFVKSKVPMLR